MRAVILAGGKGTRLRPFTTTIPKPLVPVGEKPILELLLGRLREAGVRRVTLTVNHMAELIMAFFGRGDRFGMEIDYSVEELPLGTVAPVKLVQGLPDTFFVMNGDLLTDIDLVALHNSHLASDARLTVATYSRDQLIDFGVLDIHPGDGRVTGFREKPTYRFTVSTGVYVYSRTLLDDVPDGVPYGFDDLMLDMLNRGESINTYRHTGYWLDIGRPDDYDRANLEYSQLEDAET